MLQHHTQLDARELKSTLQSLVDAKLLLTEVGNGRLVVVHVKEYLQARGMRGRRINGGSSACSSRGVLYTLILHCGHAIDILSHTLMDSYVVRGK